MVVPKHYTSKTKMLSKLISDNLKPGTLKLEILKHETLKTRNLKP